MSEFEQYYHHGKQVWTMTSTRGKHREYCLCFKCNKLNTEDREKNCPKAKALYEFDVKNDMTTPVFECPDFVEA